MKLAFFDLENWEAPVLEKAFKGHELFMSKEPLNERNIPKENDFEVISVFTSSVVNANVIGNFPNLKLIAARSTGYDHINIEAARSGNIEVVYVPGYGDNTVAEFAFGLILSLTRNIYQAIDRLKETGNYSSDGLRGVDLKGKTLGIVGVGRIGREMIRIGRGFGMRVTAFDPHPDLKFASDNSLEYLSLPDLLGVSDIVSIHCPANEETHHLINRSNIKLFKRGSFLVNTARGSIVETSALIEALNDGTIRGVALDVIEEEGEIRDEMSFIKESHPNADMLKEILMDHVLMRMPNVLMTPHVAFNSDEAVRRILDVTIENISGFFGGEKFSRVP